MGCTMDMFSPIKLAAPKGPIPDGMKVTALNGPSGTPTSPCPVLAIGGFTLWPFSYMDNRVSFGMVMYDVNWKVVSQVEKKGARYVYQITKTGTGGSGSVTFAGQANQVVTMSLDEICQMMLLPT